MTDNYPMGTEDDPRAPWNQDETPMEFEDVVVMTSMAKYCQVCNRGESLDESYLKSEYTIQEMLGLLKDYVEKDVDNKFRSAILSSIDGWFTETLTVE